MRIYFLLFFTLGIALQGWGQKVLNLEIEWNTSAKQYEVFATSMHSQNNFLLGSSQISIVLPKAAPDNKLTMKSHAGGTWQDEKIIASPSSDLDRDYHGISSKGGVINLVAKQRLLLFSFTLADGTCKNGVRLFNNNEDLSASASGFNNIDFKNSILGVANVEVYGSNVKNSGTNCLDCPAAIKIPTIRKISSP